ncbi:hypothetical protein [Brevibacterium casei]|uniref:Uncharacterized protein n=1 Tax=Brevibacterium casei TaxID=33889 RepID=A0A7T4A0F4_9MICO|nr:hypothetical protein [Brevibacterium casei]QQB15047.1 hypothetical protein I6H47_03515 [Brevibacterium casei]
MPSNHATRIAEPLLGGPDGIHRGVASAVYRRTQAYVLAGVLGVTTFLALALQAPCLSSGYQQPSAAARMCAGPLSASFLGQLNPQAVGRADGGLADLSVIDARLVGLFRLVTDDVSVFMTFVLLINVFAVAASGVALLILARQRAWLVAVFASPAILFTLGSTLDPLALALSLWAVVLVAAPAPVTPQPWLAGILLGIAAFINPLALLVLAALTLSGLHPAGRLAPRSPLMMIATATITSALILIADGTALSRIVHWTTDAIDGGSFASILLMARIGNAETWAMVWIVVSGLAVLAVGAAMVVVARRGIDPAVAACLLIGAALVFAPGLMPWDSLWILPFLALAVSRWWVLIAWALVEAVFAVAIQLGDIAASEPDKALEPSFIALFALLRLFVLIMVIVFAGENLHRRRIRGQLSDAQPPRRSDADEPRPEPAVAGNGEPPRRGDQPAESKPGHGSST